MSAEMLEIEESSGNIFADLGFEPAEATNLQMRSQCMIEIEKWFRASGLTQATAAAQLEVNQPRFNLLLKGAIDQFSLDALVLMAANAGLMPKLTVRSRKRA